MINCKSNSIIKFHDLSVGFLPDEQKHVAIVRTDTDKALRVDQAVIQIYNILLYGKTVKETAELVNRPEEDVVKLMRLFDHVGFIREIDGIALEDNTPKIKPWFVNVPRKYFKFVIRKEVVGVILATIFIGIGIAITMPQYYPNYKQFFFTERRLIVLLSILGMETVLVLIHEFAHFFTTKAVGGEASMSISYRAIYLVAETKSYHLSLVPKLKRYIVYLAGMVIDAFIAATCYILLYLNSTKVINLSDLIESLLLVVILLEIKSITWQLNVAIRTDMYNLLSDALNHRHLRENTKKFLNFKVRVIKELWKTFSNPFSLSVPTLNSQLQFFREDEMKQIKTYSKFLIFGFIFIYIHFVFFIIPRDIQLVSNAFVNAKEALFGNNLADFLEGFVIIFLLLLQYIMLTYAIIKNKSQSIDVEVKYNK